MYNIYISIYEYENISINIYYEFVLIIIILSIYRLTNTGYIEFPKWFQLIFDFLFVVLIVSTNFKNKEYV